VLTLTRITPADGASIPRGQTTQVDAVFHYEFATAARGSLAVIVLGPGAFLDAGTLAQLDSRAGDVSVALGVRVPSGSTGDSVSVRFALAPEGATTTTVSVAVNYRVAT
jgi:hypothetical protein